MFIGTGVEIPAGIRSIAMIVMSIDPECYLECPSREYLDSSHEKKYGSVGIASYGEETDSFDEAINALDGNSG